MNPRQDAANCLHNATLMNNRIYLGSIADPRRRALMKSATMLYRHSLTVALAAAIATVCLSSNAKAQAPAAPGLM